MPFDNKYRKAVTFSFDDGNMDDVWLTELFNKYGLKSTFNLNSSLLSDNETWCFNGVKQVHHINYTVYPHLYDGHEVAAHTVRHSHLEDLEYETVINEIELDRIYLKALYGYDICGMALPFGTYNDKVLKALKETGVLYCRTVVANNDFRIPDRLPLIDTTCHFMADNLDQLADRFLNDDSKEDLLFYIWGHSYELLTEQDKAKFEAFCKKISNRDDIYYCTNKEAILNYKS